MATALFMEFSDMGQAEYERVFHLLGLDAQPPDGGIFHVAGPVPGGWRVLDIWKSQAHFDRFMRDRLAPAFQEAGITQQPKVEVFEVHNVYAPGLDVITEMGRSSMP